jgi:rhomboid protease GluP
MLPAVLKKQETTLDPEGFDLKNIFLLLREAGILLDWQLTYFGEKGILFQLPFGPDNFQGEVEITADLEGLVRIRSRSLSYLPFIKRKPNLNYLLSNYHQLKENRPAEVLAQDLFQSKPLWEWDQGFKSFEERPIHFILATPVLILLNVLVFGWMFFENGRLHLPTLPEYLEMGANFRPLTLDGGYMRLVYSAFIHGNLRHLLSNLYLLAALGMVLESILGNRRFAIYVLLITIAAATGSLYWNEALICFGASGIAFGLMGMLLVFLFGGEFKLEAKTVVLANCTFFIVYNFFYGTLQTGVDNAAHLTGFLSGCFIGFLSLPGLKEPENFGLHWRITGWITVLVGSMTVMVYFLLPNDFATWKSRMAHCQSNVRFAKSHTADWEKIPAREAIVRVREDQIRRYDQNIRTCDTLRKLHVTPGLSRRSEILIQYFVMKSNYYRQLTKKLRGESDNKTLRNIRVLSESIASFEEQYWPLLSREDWSEYKLEELY